MYKYSRVRLCHRFEHIQEGGHEAVCFRIKVLGGGGGGGGLL